MKRQDEHDEREKWKKIPRRPQRNPETTAEFDFASIYAADEGIDTDAVAHGLTRDEADAWLRDCRGLSTPERALVLGRVFDGASTRQLEAATGRKKTWIAEKLKSPTIKRAIADLQSGKASLGGTAKASLSEDKTGGAAMPLHVWRWWARGRLEHFEKGIGASSSAEHLSKRIAARPSPREAKNIIKLIRSCPAVLLVNEGRRLLEALVDLLEAANRGKCQRRVPSVTQQGTRKQVAKAAREVLKKLTQRESGDRLEYPPHILDRILEHAHRRVIELQKEWQTSLGQPVALRLEAFRRKHAEELRGFTDRELRNILTGEPDSVAGRLAEKATGLSKETFESIPVWEWRNSGITPG